MKKLVIIALAAALILTLGRTNPDVGDFVRYYEGGEWQNETPLLEQMPEGLRSALDAGIEGQIRKNYYIEGQIRKNYYIASVYDFGGWRFLGVAGGFYVLTRPVQEAA